MLVWLAIPLVHAAPETAIDAEGVVVSTLTVPAAAEAVMAVIENPSRLSELSGEGISVRVVSVDGACSVLDYTSASRLATVEYRLRQCRVTDGLDVTLIDSPSFSTYDSTWRLVSTASGTEITYRLYAQTTYFLPDVLIRQSIRSGVAEMMSGLQQHFSSE